MWVGGGWRERKGRRGGRERECVECVRGRRRKGGREGEREGRKERRKEGGRGRGG